MNKDTYYELLINNFEELPMKAKTLILENECFNREFLSDISCYLSSANINSPIEIIFLVAFYIYTKGSIYINPQERIEIGNKVYYADFSISFDYFVNNSFNEDFKLVIECDGYEFHQKTKEQVDNDNQREYDLKMQGYNVLRFSGREIFKYPMQCIEKLIDYLRLKAYPENKAQSGETNE